MPVLIGSYADKISVYDTDLKPAGSPIPARSPSFLTAGPPIDRQRVVYAVGETDEGEVSAFGVDGTPLGTLPTGGASPCHLAVTGGFLLAANYVGGSVSVFALRADGALDRRTDLVQHSGSSANPDRQEGPHVHQVTIAGDVVYVVDLGLDAIVRYRLGPDGILTHLDTTDVTPAGTGPRHLVIHPSGRVFVANELASTVTAYTPDLTRHTAHPSVLVPPAGDNLPSELLLSPDATRLYVANRGNDTITTFEVTDDGLSALDEVSTGGTWPRHFALLDGALVVANQHSNTVTRLELDPATGIPQPGRTVLEHPSPTMILPLP